MDIIFKAIILVFAFLLFTDDSFAGTAFKTGELRTGTTKQCFYNYLGSTHTITIQSYEICPLTIEVK